VSLDDSQNLIFDHCSLSWSCDEVFGIVRCENVTIQWCIISEPLSNPRIHPYGDRHAFGLNTSANTLSLHHSLIANVVMRGPQFEANDVRRGMGYDVRMESINNVVFDYERSGSRYTTGIEDQPEEAEGTRFEFQFVNNHYLSPDATRPEIEAVTKHGVTPQVKVFISGNVGPHRTTGSEPALAGVFEDLLRPIRSASPAVQAQISTQRLFEPPVPVRLEPAQKVLERVLADAGASRPRDPVDDRVVKGVRERRFGGIIKSQTDVGSWPELK
jgi:hypothetical protein